MLLLWGAQAGLPELPQWSLQNQTGVGLRGTELFTRSPSGK